MVVTSMVTGAPTGTLVLPGLTWIESANAFPTLRNGSTARASSVPVILGQSAKAARRMAMATPAEATNREARLARNSIFGSN